MPSQPPHLITKHSLWLHPTNEPRKQTPLHPIHDHGAPPNCGYKWQSYLAKKPSKRLCQQWITANNLLNCRTQPTGRPLTLGCRLWSQSDQGARPEFPTDHKVLCMALTECSSSVAPSSLGAQSEVPPNQKRMRGPICSPAQFQNTTSGKPQIAG